MFSKWSTSKPKRTRIRTTPEQLAVLEASFAEQQHPEPEERLTARNSSRLAVATGMTTRRVSVWFQNRRAKERSKNGASPRPRKPRETPYVALDPPSPSRVQQEQQLLMQQQIQQQQQAQLQHQQHVHQQHQQQAQLQHQQQRGQAMFVDFSFDQQQQQQQQLQQQQLQHAHLPHPRSTSYALPTGRSLSAGATVGARGKARDLPGRSSLYPQTAAGEFAHSAPGHEFIPRREFSPSGTPMREYSPSSMDFSPSSPLSRDYRRSPSREPQHLPLREFSPTTSSPVYRRRDFRQTPAMLEFAASNSRGDYALGAVSREFSGERVPAPMYGLPPVTMEQEVRRASSTPKKHVVEPSGTDLRRFSLSAPGFQGFSSFNLGSDDPFLRLEAARAHTSSGSDDVYTEEEEEGLEEERYARKKQLLSRQKLMAQEMMVHEADGDTTMTEA